MKKEQREFSKEKKQYSLSWELISYYIFLNGEIFEHLEGEIISNTV